MGRKSTFKLDVVSIRMVEDAPLYSEKRIASPKDAVHLMGEVLREMDREVVCVLNLKSNGIPINCTFASTGALAYAVANPRELLKASILSNAANIILVHNHPSGNLLPSKADVQLTDQLQKVCEMVGIPLHDHVIIGGDNHEYFSFREKGVVRNPCMMYQTDYEELEWKDTMVAEKERRSR